MRLYDIDYVEKTRLAEGIQYGNKQKSWVENNLNGFRIGLEAELVVADSAMMDADGMDFKELSEQFDIRTNDTMGYYMTLYENNGADFPDIMTTVVLEALQDSDAFKAFNNDTIDSLVGLLKNDSVCSRIVKSDGNGSGDTEEDFGLLKLVMETMYRSVGGGFTALDDDIEPFANIDDDYVDNELLDFIFNNGYGNIDIVEIMQYVRDVNESLNQHDMVDSEGTVTFSEEDEGETLEHFMNLLTELVGVCSRNEIVSKHLTSNMSVRVSNHFFDNSGAMELKTVHDQLEEADAYMTMEDFVEEILAKTPSSANIDPRIFFNVDVDFSDSITSSIGEVEEIINEMGYSDWFEVVDEGHDMIEIITTGSITGDDIEECYDTLFEIIDTLKDRGYGTRDSDSGADIQGSGFHISISKLGYDGLVSPTKFLLLSNILQIIPNDEQYVRKYVNDIRENFNSSTSLEILVGSLIANKFKKNESLSKNYDKILEDWAYASTDTVEKFQTVNFKEMDIQNGRIEIRLYGGRNYDSVKAEMWDETIRSMYALHLASSETEGRREYLQILNRMANEVFVNHLGMDVSQYFVTTKKIYELFNGLFPDFQSKVILPSLGRQNSLMELNYAPLYRIHPSTVDLDYFIAFFTEKAYKLNFDDMDYDIFTMLRERTNLIDTDSSESIYIPDMKKMTNIAKGLKQVFSKYQQSLKREPFGSLLLQSILEQAITIR